MTRHFDDWLTAFVEYASYGEAPRHMHFWSGVSAVAGSLRRKVWIDQAYFQWHPNFYIILVAPPGIVSKSTTVGIAINLLRQVPGINFGPDIVTWPSLVTSFGAATEGFEYNGAFHTMSALTLESSEFGNLLNPQDKEMVDLLVSLWDGKPGVFRKETKGSGCDSVENPWINLIACTTPAWIAGNFPEYMIGGGFTSRCVFVYADAKAQYVAYPGLCVPQDLKATADKLVADLTHISKLAGEYRLTHEAIVWGEAWYAKHYAEKPANFDDERFGGYLARKQTHIHKLAIVVAASASDRLEITAEDLALANTMTTDLESDMAKVFSKIGKTQVSVHADRIVAFVERNRECTYMEVYRFIHAHFPSLRDFEDVISGCVKAGLLRLVQVEGGIKVMPGAKLSPEASRLS